MSRALQSARQQEEHHLRGENEIGSFLRRLLGQGQNRHAHFAECLVVGSSDVQIGHDGRRLLDEVFEQNALVVGESTNRMRDTKTNDPSDASAHVVNVFRVEDERLNTH